MSGKIAAAAAAAAAAPAATFGNPTVAPAPAAIMGRHKDPRYPYSDEDAAAKKVRGSGRHGLATSGRAVTDREPAAAAPAEQEAIIAMLIALGESEEFAKEHADAVEYLYRYRRTDTEDALVVVTPDGKQVDARSPAEAARKMLGLDKVRRAALCVCVCMRVLAALTPPPAPALPCPQKEADAILASTVGPQKRTRGQPAEVRRAAACACPALVHVCAHKS